MTDYAWIVVDRPLDGVQRIPLNRPEKRNPLSNALRGELFDALLAGDRDPEMKCSILRGAGGHFSAGYDLKQNAAEGQPFYTPPGLGNWPRHVVDGFFFINDLAKPVIAQVEGYCLAGGTELATACDLVYCAEDAKIGYPVVRAISPPDNQFYPWIVGLRRAMEMMLTGDSISGREAVDCGFANRAHPAEALEAAVLEVARKIARVPTDVQQFNKRAVHRQMELMGFRAAVRAGTELKALAMLGDSARAHLRDIRDGGLTQALSKRDAAYGDYREGGSDE
ncbi:MAG: enoyl-CoA hydratase-related protein [Pseudomonadales bacterium]|nr:enoyl-CoA hydratase-related protein [Pseudomonadales bacterium]